MCVYTERGGKGRERKRERDREGGREREIYIIISTDRSIYLKKIA